MRHILLMLILTVCGSSAMSMAFQLVNVRCSSFRSSLSAQTLALASARCMDFRVRQKLNFVFQSGLWTSKLRRLPPFSLSDFMTQWRYRGSTSGLQYKYFIILRSRSRCRAEMDPGAATARQRGISIRSDAYNFQNHSSCSFVELRRFYLNGLHVEARHDSATLEPAC